LACKAFRNNNLTRWGCYVMVIWLLCCCRILCLFRFTSCSKFLVLPTLVLYLFISARTVTYNCKLWRSNGYILISKKKISAVSVKDYHYLFGQKMAWHPLSLYEIFYPTYVHMYLVWNFPP
jgi:hypothetical protein